MWSELGTPRGVEVIGKEREGRKKWGKVGNFFLGVKNIYETMSV